MRAQNPYLKIDKYSNSLSHTGIDDEDTKNPAKSMNGMISTGVKVTASYLSENDELMIIEQPLEALQIKISVTINIQNLSLPGFKPTEKYTIIPKIVGVISENGNSEKILAQK